MKNKIKYALIGSALVFGACGDYSVDSEDVVIKTSNIGNCNKDDDNNCINKDVNFYATPVDYDFATYISLNPDIKYFQIISQLRSFDNKPRLDSMADAATKAEATARYNADNAKFLSDEAFAKEVFLIAGYPESMWKGVDSLKGEQKTILYRYNKQQIGEEPSVEADKEYIRNFKYDESLMELHYSVFGVLSGRPYRTCTDGDIKIPSGQMAGHYVVSKERSSDKEITKICSLADTLGKSPRILDYSAFYFCYNESDGQTYPIWNEAMSERLNRIAFVNDSLQAAAPVSSSDAAPASSSAAAPESSSEATPESSSGSAPESSSEAAPESSSEVAPESSSEATPESSSEAIPESSSEAAPESSSVTDPESSSSATI